jgi:Zn-dependent protease
VRVSGGYLEVGSVGRVPVLFHWSLPLGMLWLSSFTLRPGVWLGYLTVILVHEAGHALLVRRYGLAVHAIEVHALGGLCRHAGGATPEQTSVIAWGGVLAQALLYGATTALLAVLPLRPGPLLWQFVSVLLTTNLWLIAINLLPLPGLDGAQAWRLPLHWWRRGPGARGGHGSQTAAQRSRRRDRDALPPTDLFPGRNAPPQSKAFTEPSEAEIKERVERILRDATRKP